jgi:hypothetical protein
MGNIEQEAGSNYRTSGERAGTQNSLVVCDESGHTKFPFSFVVLSWGELSLILP